MLGKKNILLGVTGSIAAYKSPDIARRLMEEGANVTVVMTKAACRFIPPYTLETVTGNPVYTDLFNDTLSHIHLPKQADLFVIAPATANTINKLSCGIADDLLSTIWLAYEGRLVVAPAMNCRMYGHPIVQKSIRELAKLGVEFVGPARGSLACGDEGPGRMVEVPDIIEAAIAALTEKDFAGMKILVTAGPTREPVDPVRYISNRSSGKMGYAVARAASRRGAEVTLISGPSSQEPPPVKKFIKTGSASEMSSAVMKHLPGTGTVIMAAAVSDFAPSSTAKVKLDKKGFNTLKLKKNKDILKEIGRKKGRRVLAGFAAETGSNVERAKKKLKDKNLDLIVFNDVTQKDSGFDVDTNIVTIISKNGRVHEYPVMRKLEVANVILDEILTLK